MPRSKKIKILIDITLNIGFFDGKDLNAYKKFIIRYKIHNYKKV